MGGFELQSAACWRRIGSSLGHVTTRGPPKPIFAEDAIKADRFSETSRFIRSSTAASRLELANYIPLLTTAVAFAFSLLLARQYFQRRRVHQLLWTVAMAFYAISAFMEFLMNPDVMGANLSLFRVYYVLAAPLVGLLGAGVVYLLAKRGVARLFLGFVVVFSLALVATGLTASLNASTFVSGFSGGLAQGISAASSLYPMTVRVFAIVLNSVGGVALIVGALYSFLRDMSRTYNLFIAVGGVLPMAGGALLGLFESSDLFFAFELGGTVFLFLGFLLSAGYITRREAAKAAPTSNP